MVPDCFRGQAWVETDWKIKSDHFPVGSRLHAERSLGSVAHAPQGLKGWSPKSKENFQRACIKSAGVDLQGGGCGLTLGSFEKIVQKIAAEVPHTTAASHKKMRSMKPQALLDAKRAWKSESSIEMRRERRRLYQCLKRQFDRSRCSANLKSLSQCRPSSKHLPTTLMVAPGIETSSRTEWRNCAFAHCSQKYWDPANTEHVQRQRLQSLKSTFQNYELDGIPCPKLHFGTVVAMRASMKVNTMAGIDGVVVEIWQALPVILLIVVWQLFCLRLACGTTSVNDDWRTIDLTGIPKLRAPSSISDFRFIAKTPTFQKWYLKCVLAMVARSLRPSHLHVYGFRSGSCTGLVTELIRQALHLAVQWGKPVYVMSLDIATAFDDMLHGKIAEALCSRGVHPKLVYAILLEYLDLRARVKLADSDPTDYFHYSKAGRQGGVETPELFNLMMEGAASSIATSWTQRGFGFSLDGKHFITHAVWADNWFLFAKTEAEAKIMVAELSTAIYDSGFVWKPSSLECLTSANVEEPMQFSFIDPRGHEMKMAAVDHMVALGVLLDRSGSTEATFNHRMAQADKVFYAYFRQLSNPSGPVGARLQAFMGTAAQAFLYNCPGWHFTENVLERLKRWEGLKLRKVFRMKPAPFEERSAYMLRSGQRLRSWIQKCKVHRCHERALLQYHSRASKVVNFKLPCGSQPLRQLLQARCLKHWTETKDGNLWLDPLNATGWRHARGGKQSHWEHGLVAVHGVDWWDAAGAQTWRNSRQDFVQKLCTLWHLQSPPTEVQMQKPTSAAHLSLPQWMQKDLEWHRSSGSFELRVDNALLAQWMSGMATVNTGTYQARVYAALDILRSMVQHQGLCPRHPWSDWVVWVPRERNMLADKLANMCLDMGRSFAMQSMIPPTSANFITVSDGASRGSTKISAASWALLAADRNKINLVAAGAIYLDSYATSLEAELVGLELAIGALLKASRGYESIVPHSTESRLNAVEFLETNYHLLDIVS